MADAFTELERGTYTALETYSNVHRGSGYKSAVTTRLYEKARDIVLDHFGLKSDTHVVIFSSPGSTEELIARFKTGTCHILSSNDLGLPLGVRALALSSRSFPRGAPPHAGGGTARLVAPGWVVWARPPERFEAGTPAIVNVIMFAKALRMLRRNGKTIFHDVSPVTPTASDIIDHDELERFSGRELLDQLRLTRIGGGIETPVREGTAPFINFDNAASTPTFAPVWEAARAVCRLPEAQRRLMIQNVKLLCGGFLGAPPEDYEVIFTANTTEAINLVARNPAWNTGHDIEPVVLNSVLEHNSNELPWREFSQHPPVRLPIDSRGFIDLASFEGLLAEYNGGRLQGKKRITLVALTGASNVLGTCNPLAEIGRIAHKHGARLLVDGAQLIAHHPVEIHTWGIDYFAFSGHKMYAPFGTGALIARKNLITSSSSEPDQRYSSGEENIMGIAALGKAIVLLQRIGFDVIRREEQTVTARLLRGMANISGVHAYGITDPQSPDFSSRSGVISFKVEGVFAHQLAKEVAEQGGFGLRHGCHCAHMLVKRLLNVPWALEQFQRLLLTLFPKLSLPGITRVSIGIENTGADADIFLRTLESVITRLRSPRKGKMTDNKERIAGAVKNPVQHRILQAAEDAERRVYELPA